MPAVAARLSGAFRRLMTSRPGETFSSPRDDDLDYQSRLLGTAKVELVILAQTSASVFVDDYDETVSTADECRCGCAGDHLGAGDRPRGARVGGAADRARLALFRAGQSARGRSVRAPAGARNRGIRRLWRHRLVRRRAISARRTRATPSAASTGPRSRCLSFPAEISRRWHRSSNGSANSTSRW